MKPKEQIPWEKHILAYQIITKSFQNPAQETKDITFTKNIVWDTTATIKKSEVQKTWLVHFTLS